MNGYPACASEQACADCTVRGLSMGLQRAADLVLTFANPDKLSAQDPDEVDLSMEVIGALKKAHEGAQDTTIPFANLADVGEAAYMKLDGRCCNNE